MITLLIITVTMIMIIGVEQDHSSKANHDPSEHVRRENGVKEANET